MHCLHRWICDFVMNGQSLNKLKTLTYKKWWLKSMLKFPMNSMFFLSLWKKKSTCPTYKHLAPNMDTFHIVICNIKCKGANLQLPCIVSLRSSLPHGDASISVISRSNDQYGLVIYVYLNCPHSVLERRLTASQILWSCPNKTHLIRTPAPISAFWAMAESRAHCRSNKA